MPSATTGQGNGVMFMRPPDASINMTCRLVRECVAKGTENTGGDCDIGVAIVVHSLPMSCYFRPKANCQ